MIPPAEISRMAHRLGLGDKTIEKDYVLMISITCSPTAWRMPRWFRIGSARRWPITD